jgi:hypothetical protein
VAWGLLGLFSVPLVELVVVGPVVALVYAFVAVPRAQLVDFAQQARRRALALRPERRRLGPPAA